jgi:hypothetical protein
MTDHESTAREDSTNGGERASPFAIINRYVQNRGVTERILFALTESNLTITPTPHPGMVTIPLEDAKSVFDCCGYSQMLSQEQYDRIQSAIAAAEGDPT